MKNKVIGTGITAREVVFYETPEEQYSYLKKHFSGRTFDFENLILKRIERIAWNELEAAKYTRGKLLKQIPRINAGHIDPEHEDLDVIRAALSLTGNKPDSKEGYAAEWLNTIHFIRALRERDPDMSLRMTFELGQSYGVAVMKFKWQPAALRGIPFIEGPKKPRMDALARVMEAAYRDLKKRNSGEPTARKLWEYLPNADPMKEVIQQQTTNNLEWLRNGELEDLDFVGFKKRYGRFRKKLYRKPRRKLR